MHNDMWKILSGLQAEPKPLKQKKFGKALLETFPQRGPLSTYGSVVATAGNLQEKLHAMTPSLRLFPSFPCGIVKFWSIWLGTRKTTAHTTLQLRRIDVRRGRASHCKPCLCRPMTYSNVIITTNRQPQ